MSRYGAHRTRTLRFATLALTVLAGRAGAQSTQGPPTPGAATPGPPASAVRPAEPTGLSRFFDPATAPILPIPEIDHDPYSGTTLGLIPTYLVNDEHGQIRQIIAPDIIHNEFFGWGARARFFDYPSANTQWFIVAGAKQRVESEFDGEYSAGLLRDDAWSFSLSLVYDRSGSPRFFGIGNDTHLSGESNYTDQQKFIQWSLGRNLSQKLQVGFTNRVRQVQILPGAIAGIPSIQEVYPGTVIRAERREILNRLYVDYDTRDDRITPTRGMEWVGYIGAAAGTDVINGDLYSEAGIDGRKFWGLSDSSILVGHVALRYMPRTAHTAEIPFWALSSVGGDRAVIGGDQPLRGFGAGRFVDRNSFSASLEWRKRIASINAVGTRIALELAPFLDTGRVFSSAGTDPLSHLHKVGGIGFRGIASPFVVGYVDVGYGSEGAAVFTGLNYPF